MTRPIVKGYARSVVCIQHFIGIHTSGNKYYWNLRANTILLFNCILKKYSKFIYNSETIHAYFSLLSIEERKNSG